MGQLSLLVCNTCYYLRGKPPLQFISGGIRSQIRNKNDNTIKSYVINIVKDDKDNLENYSNNVLDYDDIDDNNNYVSDDESTVNVESNNDSISNVNTNNMNLDSRNETKKEKKLFFPKIILAVSYILILVGLIAIFVVKKLKNKK